MNGSLKAHRVAVLCGILLCGLLVLSASAQQIRLKRIRKPLLTIREIEDPPRLTASASAAVDPSVTAAETQQPAALPPLSRRLKANPLARRTPLTPVGGILRRAGRIPKGPEDEDSDEETGTEILPENSIRVLSPNGGETLAPGSVCEIGWDTAGRVGTPTITILRRGAPTRYSYPSSSVFGTRTRAGWRWSWTVPRDLPAGSDYQVRLEARAVDPLGRRPYVTARDVSDRSFTVAGRNLVVRGPRARETVHLTSEVSLSWTSYGSTDNVNVFLYRAGTSRVPERALQMLWESAPHSASRRWIVGRADGSGGDTVLEPGNYFIRVMSIRDASLRADTPVFSIARPYLEVREPNGGERIRGDRSYTVRWSARHLRGNVDIELWSTSRRIATLATDVRPSAFSHTSTWFPAPSFGVGSLTADYAAAKIRIVSTRLPYVFDESDATFYIDNSH